MQLSADSITDTLGKVPRNVHPAVEDDSEFSSFAGTSSIGAQSLGAMGGLSCATTAYQSVMEGRCTDNKHALDILTFS